MAETAELIFSADSSQILKAEQALESLNAEGAKTQTALNGIKGKAKELQGEMGRLTLVSNNTATANGRLTNSFNLQKGALQQASFQLQDFFVQVGSGQSAVTAFAQQGPQLASIFGPGGAVIGALIAVSAVIGGPFIKSFFDAKDASEKLDAALAILSDTLRTTEDGTVILSEGFVQLAAKAESFAILQARVAKQAAFEKMASDVALLKENLGGLATQFGQINSIQQEIGQAQALNRLAAKYGLTLEQVKELRAATAEWMKTGTAEDAKILADRIANIANNSKTSTEEFDKMAHASVGLAMSLLEQQAAVDKLNEAQKNLDGTIKTSTESGIRQGKEDAKRFEDMQKRKQKAMELQQDIIWMEHELMALFEEDRRKADEARERDLKRSEQIQQQNYQQQLNAQFNFASQMGAILQQGADQNSAAAKAGYLVTQGVQVAQAINNSNLAYTGMIAAAASAASLAGPAEPAVYATGMAQAEMTRAIGYATAAMIAGNAVGTVAARSQGGQVRPGQAYRVGEFGAETFVPNTMGRIVPNDSTSSGGKINLVTNVKVIGGTQNAQVTNTTTQIDDRKFVQDIVVDLMANVTSPARNALHKTSNVRPVGQR